MNAGSALPALLPGRHSQVLATAWRQQRNPNPRRWAWLIALLIVVCCLPTVLVAWLNPSMRTADVAAITVAGLLQMLWVMQFSSLLQQNHPNAARLVPGHLRVLRESMLGLWLLLAALTALLGGASLAWGCQAALAMVLSALTVRLPVFRLPIGFAPLGFGLAFRHADWQTLRDSLSSLAPASQLTLLCGAGLLLASLLCLLLQDGGTAHIRSYASAERMRSSLRQGMGGRDAICQSRGPWRLLGLIAMRPQRLWTRRLLARAQPGPRSVMARAELALGAHWSGRVGAALLCATLFMLAAGFVRFGFGEHDWNRQAASVFAFAIATMSLAVNLPLTQLVAFHNSRREQALLMLLPGMPRGAALNRRLARRQGLQLLIGWSLAMGFLCAWTAGTYLLGSVIACGCAELAGALLLWRDWSRLQAPSSSTQVLQALVTVGAGAAAWCVVLLDPARLAVPVIAALLLLTLLIGLWRWRRLAAYPQAFPAGRLAK